MRVKRRADPAVLLRARGWWRGGVNVADTGRLLCACDKRRSSLPVRRSCTRLLPRSLDARRCRSVLGGLVNIPRWLLLAVLTAPGCAGSPTLSPASQVIPPVVSGVRPGDAIRVSIWHEADLSGEFTVNANGAVVLPLVGEKRVAGVPVAEIERGLAEEYRAYLENPSVGVTVLRRLAIYGEVRNPNLYMVDETVTLRDALAMAGGILPTGDRNRVRLLRDGRVLVARLNLGRMVGEMPIRSGDEIEVGEQGWTARNRSWLAAAVGAVTTLTAALILRR